MILQQGCFCAKDYNQNVLKPWKVSDLKLGVITRKIRIKFLSINMKLVWLKIWIIYNLVY